MTQVKHVAPAPLDIRSLVELHYPHVQVEDAFVVPKWFYFQDLWLEDRWSSENALYNYPIGVRIVGPLDHKLLTFSVGQVLRKHTVLRSIFRKVDGNLVQIVVPPPTPHVSILDLRRVTSQREAKVQDVIAENARQPFALKHDMPFRVTLLRLDEHDHVLLLTTHHIVCDDWSTGILVRDLFDTYAKRAVDPSYAIAELPFQYPHFVRWLEAQSNREKSHCARWLLKLTSSTGFYHLQPDRPRPAGGTTNGAKARFEVSKELREALTRLSNRHHMTLFMTMLAAFQCLLHLYSGHEDIGIGTCAANRPLCEVEGLIGRFANDIVVRTDLSGNPALTDVLLRTRDAALEAYNYQNIPFGSILEQLVPQRDLSHTPLFQVMFILQNAPVDTIPELPVKVERMWLDSQTAKYDLTVWLKMNDVLEITFEYKRDLFETHTINQLHADYIAIMGILTGKPEVRLNDLKYQLRAVDTGSGNTGVADVHDGRGVQVERIEAELINIWREVLSVDTVGLDHNFFDLGGDSVRATALLLKIEQRFTAKLSFKTLLGANTVRQQAEILAQTSLTERAHETRKLPLSAAGSVPNARQQEVPHKVSDGAFDKSIAGKSVFRRVSNRILHVLCRVLPGSTNLRPFLHRLRGVHIQGRVWIGDDVYIENEYPEAVEIHDGAMIGIRTTIVAHTRGAGKIIIGKQAFIGASSVLVTSSNRTLSIGEGAVLMASSVVSSDVEPYTLYGVERAKPLARLTKPFAAETGYDEFITSLRPLTRASDRVPQASGSDGS